VFSYERGHPVGTWGVGTRADFVRDEDKGLELRVQSLGGRALQLEVEGVDFCRTIHFLIKCYNGP